MATYEEEKKKRPDDYVAQTYAPPTPTARYAGSDSERMYNAIIQRYAEAADPQRQAEQDARIQRGRNFWTGANLFANVIANAINANGTAKGAPNMTWNDAPSQKMYDVWRDADKQLRADRKEAQQRYEAMALQDANMRMADQQAADKEALNTYNMNFNLQNDAAKANWNRELKEYDMQEARQQKLEDEERANKEWERRNDIQYKQNERLARIRHSGSGSSSSKSSNGGVSVSVGSIDIPAKDKNDAVKKRKDIANKIVEVQNKKIEEENKKRKITDQIPLLNKPKNDKESEQIIYQYGDIYDDDTDFRKDINNTYGIEDIYAKEVPVDSTPSAPAPSSSASASGVGQRVGQYQDGGYFIGARVNNQDVPLGYDINVRGPKKLEANSGVGRASYPLEGGRAGGPFAGYDLGRNSGYIAGEVPGQGYGREDRYVGTERAPHELTEEEKKLIKKNGEKPKINY